MNETIAVIGPTASGKSSVAFELARRLNGEIVSCDSMQIYKGLDIGTAKATADEKKEIRHHLIDILGPEAVFSVSEYVKQAKAAIDDISSRNKTPVICGGTGLYYSSLVKGITFTDDGGTDDAIRTAVREEAESFGIEKLIRELEMADPDHAHLIERENKKRIMRSVELLRSRGITVAQQTELSQSEAKPLQVKAFMLYYEDRNKLYDRINRRVDCMVEEGVLDEARYVYVNREKFSTASAAIGYKEFFPYFEGISTLQECIDKLKQATRNYAKRQMTWFRKVDAVRIYMDSIDASEASDLIMEFMRKEIS